MKISFTTVILASLISLCCCTTNSEVSSSPRSQISSSTQGAITGKVVNERNYSGQDCVLYKNKLYWTESKGYDFDPEKFELVGEIIKMVDKIPDENFTSAKSKSGSKIYIRKNDENEIRIFVEGELEAGKKLLISFVQRSIK